MRVRYYCSNHLLGLGSFVAIVTSQYVDGTRDIVSEVFMFRMDGEKYYFAHSVKYTDDPDIEFDKIRIDQEYMEEEAINLATNEIKRLLFDLYKDSEDRDYLRENINFQECKYRCILTLKNVYGYRDELKRTAEHTKSLSLKEYIKFILSIKIEFSPYEK